MWALGDVHALLICSPPAKVEGHSTVAYSTGRFVQYHIHSTWAVVGTGEKDFRTDTAKRYSGR